MKIVVVSPHRDDAAFSLSLAIESWLRDRHSITIVNCFTRSEYAPFHDLTFVHPNDRMSYVSALRAREDRTWSRQLAAGASTIRLNLTDLNLKDAPRRLRCTADEVCSLQPQIGDKAALKIQKALERASPDALVFPLALGHHVDHLVARNAAVEFMSRPTPCAFYEDLPYAGRPGIADTIEASARSIDPHLAPSLDGDQQGPTVGIDRKRRLALCYDSQIDDATAGLIANFCGRYNGRERLWVNASWQASQLASVSLGSSTQTHGK